MSEHQSQLAPAANKFHVGNGDDGKHYWLTPPQLLADLGRQGDRAPHRLLHPQTGVDMNRRGFITGLGALLATSALVKPMTNAAPVPPAARGWYVAETLSLNMVPDLPSNTAWRELMRAYAKSIKPTADELCFGMSIRRGEEVIPVSDLFAPDSE